MQLRSSQFKPCQLRVWLHSVRGEDGLHGAARQGLRSGNGFNAATPVHTHTAECRGTCGKTVRCLDLAEMLFN